jgi:hypothetical protein
MANLKSFEQFVAEQDRAEEIEKDIVDQGTPEEHDAEEADVVQSQGQETNEATDVTGIQADELKDDSKDVTPPVVDADGKEYAKAEDRAEDDSKELEADLAKTANGEVTAKIVVEAKALSLDKLAGMIGKKPSCYDLADFVYTNYDKVTGLKKSMRNDEMDFPTEITDLVDHYGFDLDDFTDKYGMAAESLNVNENLDRASIKRMEGVVSQANLKKMLDGISGVIADLTDDGFEYEEAVDYVAFKIDDKLAGKF